MNSMGHITIIRKHLLLKLYRLIANYYYKYILLAILFPRNDASTIDTHLPFKH